MITNDDILNMNFYKKEQLTGSRETPFLPGVPQMQLRPTLPPIPLPSPQPKLL